MAAIFFQANSNMMVYPLSICAGCILTSILGTYFVKLGKNKNIMNYDSQKAVKMADQYERNNRENTLFSN